MGWKKEDLPLTIEVPGVKMRTLRGQGGMALQEQARRLIEGGRRSRVGIKEANLKWAMRCTAVLATAATVACSRPETRIPEPPDAKLAREFAEALGAREFDRAHGLLAAETRSTVAAAELEAEYAERIPASAGAPTEIEIVNVENDWPEKQTGDVVRVYVGIGAGPRSAMFQVVVSEADGTRFIRAIDWQ